MDVKIEITGGRGTGKTHALAVILDALCRDGYTVSLLHRRNIHVHETLKTEIITCTLRQ